MLETPILDRRQPIPQFSQSRKSRTLGPGFVGLIVLGVLMASLLLPVMMWLVVCVLAHELGHLLAGLVVRREFRYFIAGPFVVSRHSGGLQFSFRPRRLLGGGLVLMVPSGAEWSRRGELIGIAGGPVVTALMFLPVIVLPWSQLTICLAVANTLVAAGSWIPITLGGQATDAKMFIRFARAPSETFAAIRGLWALDYAGTTPCNWPPELVNQLVLLADDMACGFLARQYRYLYLRECGDPLEAAAALESVLAIANELPPDVRRSYFSEAAFFQGMFGNSSVLAREWLEEARKVDVVLPERDWEAYPLAAIAIAEGEPEAARSFIINAIAALDRHPSTSGSVAALRARLVALAA